MRGAGRVTNREDISNPPLGLQGLRGNLLPGDRVRYRGLLRPPAGVGYEVELSVPIHVAGDETMRPLDLRVHLAAFPIGGKRLIRALQPEYPLVRTAEVQVAISIHIQQGAVNTPAARPPRPAGGQLMYDNPLLPVGALQEHHLA